ncbi:Flp family type IVb pilin [Arthrobacter sp. FW306-05-C]|uniref:Flp family type IVb pilin n=1 Tax=Arthrobacter sp. FW306-05-C TaxID=2879620 RepID=UPI001F44A5D7|nr:Flp family type IVb pilin [Arthrobacter sp. FW306-05-C]UKA65654.1 Flp family type IVb pilin [Arthrobacter sp. FW306-05-C]
MTSLMVSMTAFIAGVKDRLLGEEKGATAVEYGLMVALIVIAAIVGITAVGTNLQQLFQTDIAGRL